MLPMGSGAPVMPAAVGGRETEGQLHRQGQLSPMWCGVFHRLSQHGLVILL